MSYAGMKPMQEEQHTYLAEWVKKGGVLIYCARDNDPFQSVMGVVEHQREKLFGPL